MVVVVVDDDDDGVVFVSDCVTTDWTYEFAIFVCVCVCDWLEA